MPTDEQLREQFEAWATKIYGFTDAEYKAAWEDTYRYYTHDILREYWPPFQAAWLARDAEVQALREALTEVTEDLASEILAKHGPIRAHPDTVRSFDRDMEPVRRAWKLLAGGEQ